MAGVPAKVVKRAQIISTDFYKAFNEKLDARRRSALPLPAHADFVYLMKVALGRDVGLAPLGSDGKFVGKASLRQQLDMVRQCIGTYEV
jgi:DNA mismatch repair protein MSH6